MAKEIGLKRGIVKISPYNKSWPKLFLTEKELLEKTLSPRIKIIDIQHVGSTAIPKISAKPIIDIALAVEDIDKAKICLEPLEKIGYHFRPDASSENRVFLAKGPEENRTIYLHIEKHQGQDWKNLIQFRDYLIKDKSARDEYQKLKQDLFLKYADDRPKYTALKNKFIQNIIKK